ncbi:MAG: peptidase M16 [Desulfobacterales bacterium]|nr:peptidase M16 [Desulfobacterales bacterium]
MSAPVDANKSDLKPGGRVRGYTVQRVETIKPLNLVFYELEHTDTGARHIHLANKDKDNAFGVILKTVPRDSTGVAHILEHTALCGSDKFPVRDPFFSMLKRSLSTFMNALTASDWTMYPFSTQNRKDYYNLLGVYLDAVFHPNLDELSFKQEGHRIEVEKEGDGKSRLVYKGVVYNEMKGAMSSPDQVLSRALLKALYPDTTYSNNSGGDPAMIPRLTHEGLLAFHKRHYHPSNAYFFTYGNLPLKDHLAFIEEKTLARFKPIDPGTDVSPQSRWSEPRRTTHYYPLARNEDPSRKFQVCVAWLTADIVDTLDILTQILLERILLGNAASPLRKALIESGLGSTLSDRSGLEPDNRDAFFSCGLKDVAKEDAGKIERIIFDVLEGLARDGLDPALIESAIHQIEFNRKEVRNRPYPYSLNLLLTLTGAWIHGGDPVKALHIDEDLDKIRAEMARGPYFENQIKKHFLENPHRVVFTLAPDQDLEERRNKEEASELEKIRGRLKDPDIGKLKKDAEALRLRQEMDENVSCLPTLELEDIPPSVRAAPESDAHPGVPGACYQQPTSGIFYFTSFAGVGSLEPRLMPLAPVFCHVFPKIGTALRDYADMARLMDAYTGGVGLSSHVHTRFDETGACTPYFSLNGKCLIRNQEKMFDILSELLFESKFSDLNRLKSLLLEYKAGMEANVVRSGHRYAMLLASRNFSSTCAIGEEWHGVHQLQTIKNLTENLTDEKLSAIASDLMAIGKQTFTRDNVRMALVGEDHALASASDRAASLFKGFGKGEVSGFEFPRAEEGPLPMEGWGVSTSVSFVAQCFRTVRLPHEDAPRLSVISRLLRSLYLHREIREKGGAYGGFALYDSEDGLFSFGSYRDPHIVSTLNVYKSAADFIRSGDYTDEDIKEAILQVCSEIDKPDAPGAAGRKAFHRKTYALSDEMRLDFKQRLLSVTRPRVQETAERYFAGPEDQRAVVVISNKEKLNGANQQLKERPLKLFDI